MAKYRVPLSPWCKSVKHALIDKGWDNGDLAKEIGRSREYTCSVINGRVYAPATMSLISDVLNIPYDAAGPDPQ